MNLTELLKLRELTTKGHWQVEIDRHGVYIAVVDDGPIIAHCGPLEDEVVYANACFIVEAHNALEDILAQVVLEKARV